MTRRLRTTESCEKRGSGVSRLIHAFWGRMSIAWLQRSFPSSWSRIPRRLQRSNSANSPRAMHPPRPKCERAELVMAKFAPKSSRNRSSVRSSAGMISWSSGVRRPCGFTSLSHPCVSPPPLRRQCLPPASLVSVRKYETQVICEVLEGKAPRRSNPQAGWRVEFVD